MELPITIHRTVRESWRELVMVHGLVAAAGMLALVALMPLVPALLPVLTLIVCIALIVRHREARTTSRWRAWNTPLPYAIALYLMHVIGMLWTADQAFGWFDLQVKAPLLVFPLLALWMPRSAWVGRGILVFAFSISCTIAVAICIAAAAWRVASGTGLSAEQVVFSSAWSLFLHPSYFAWYLCTAIAAWCLLPIPRRLNVWIDRAVLAFLAVGVVLCGSKIGWLLLVVELVTLLVLRWGDTRLRSMLQRGILGSMIAIVALVSGSRYARDRVQEAWHAATEGHHEATGATSSEVRWLTWASARELIAEHPIIGTGTGDIKDELMRVYRQRGYTTAADHRLNAHDQFLQTAACLGIPGLLLLVVMLLVPLFARGGRDEFTVVFLLITLVNWLVESMLEVQAGTLFFSFFACVTLWSDDHRSSPPNSSSSGHHSFSEGD